MNNETNTRKTAHRLLASLFDFAELFVIAICVVILFFTFGARLCKVSGDSMLQTLHNGEMLLVSDFCYEPAQGDIVVFHQTHPTYERLNEAIVKRIIATEGQYVYIDYDTAKVYVSDDSTFDESDIIDEDYDYIDNYTGTIVNPYYAKGKEYFIPEGYVFVLGDNRNNSLDSRSAEIGLVDTRRILGKVVLRLTPLSDFGKVD